MTSQRRVRDEGQVADLAGIFFFTFTFSALNLLLQSSLSSPMSTITFAQVLAGLMDAKDEVRRSAEEYYYSQTATAAGAVGVREEYTIERDVLNRIAALIKYIAYCTFGYWYILMPSSVRSICISIQRGGMILFPPLLLFSSSL